MWADATEQARLVRDGEVSAVGLVDAAIGRLQSAPELKRSGGPAKIRRKCAIAGLGSPSEPSPGRGLLIDVEVGERLDAVFVGGAAVGAGGLEAGVAEELGPGSFAWSRRRPYIQ